MADLAFVSVRWLDASMSNPHWQSGDLPEVPTDTANVMLSAGFLAQDTDAWVVLVQTVGEGCFANSIEIPRGMIIEIKTIENPIHS